MANMKIKKGDLVKVIAGKDKNKEGKVIDVNVKDNTVLVEGVNVVKKHTKPNAQNQQGGIVNMESPINVSNVMLVFKGTATRVGYKYEESSKGLVKVRVAKKTGEVID
ncbi:MAG: 50S ribosomal protein L24 [Lachnospiraceae bacterium]|nr:50S ribosomal protein L24 [Lachnospiraceae bacterium]